MQSTSATMRAAKLSGPMQFRIEQLPRPSPGARTVRVRLEGCGVCGSNLAPWEGRPWFKYPLAPGEPGHEGWGEVEAVGSEVKTVRPGDRVTLLGYHSYAECDVVPEEALVKLPQSLAGRLFPGEALGCAMNVFRRSGIREGETVAIVGIGFLGALLTQLAAGCGARVVAVSRRAFALEMARGCGACEVVALDDNWRVAGQVKDLTGGAGCDCVIEAVGLQGPLDLASELTRERGRLIIAGYHQDGARQVNMQQWNWRGLDVINAHERDPRVYLEGIRAAVGAVAEGRLNPAPLLTHFFPLEKISEAFECMRGRPEGFLKAVVKYD
jgi:threonine dehydrogenase-like Zn-dependent dehydrogenase